MFVNTKKHVLYGDGIIFLTLLAFIIYLYFADKLTLFYSIGAIYWTVASPLTWQVFGLVVGISTVFDVLVNSYSVILSNRLSNMLSIVRSEYGLEQEEELPHFIKVLISNYSSLANPSYLRDNSRISGSNKHDEKEAKYLQLNNSSKIEEKPNHRLNLIDKNEVEIPFVTEKENKRKEVKMAEEELSDIIKST